MISTSILMNDDNEITYFSVRWKAIKLGDSTAPKQELKPASRTETNNGPISRGSQTVVSVLRDLWSKELS